VIATSGFLTAIECTQFVFSLCSPRLPSWFKGPYFLREGRGEEKERDRGGEGEGRERKGKG